MTWTPEKARKAEELISKLSAKTGLTPEEAERTSQNIDQLKAKLAEYNQSTQKVSTAGDVVQNSAQQPSQLTEEIYYEPPKTRIQEVLANPQERERLNLQNWYSNPDVASDINEGSSAWKTISDDLYKQAEQQASQRGKKLVRYQDVNFTENPFAAVEGFFGKNILPAIRGVANTLTAGTASSVQKRMDRSLQEAVGAAGHEWQPSAPTNEEIQARNPAAFTAGEFMGYVSPSAPANIVQNAAERALGYAGRGVLGKAAVSAAAGAGSNVVEGTLQDAAQVASGDAELDEMLAQLPERTAERALYGGGFGAGGDLVAQGAGALRNAARELPSNADLKTLEDAGGGTHVVTGVEGTPAIQTNIDAARQPGAIGKAVDIAAEKVAPKIQQSLEEQTRQAHNKIANEMRQYFASPEGQTQVSTRAAVEDMIEMADKGSFVAPDGSVRNVDPQKINRLRQEISNLTEVQYVPAEAAESVAKNTDGIVMEAEKAARLFNKKLPEEAEEGGLVGLVAVVVPSKMNAQTVTEMEDKIYRQLGYSRTNTGKDDPLWQGIERGFKKVRDQFEYNVDENGNFVSRGNQSPPPSTPPTDGGPSGPQNPFKQADTNPALSDTVLANTEPADLVEEAIRTPVDEIDEISVQPEPSSNQTVPAVKARGGVELRSEVYSPEQIMRNLPTRETPNANEARQWYAENMEPYRAAQQAEAGRVQELARQLDIEKEVSPLESIAPPRGEYTATDGLKDVAKVGGATAVGAGVGDAAGDEEGLGASVAGLAAAATTKGKSLKTPNWGGAHFTLEQLKKAKGFLGLQGKDWSTALSHISKDDYEKLHNFLIAKGIPQEKIDTFNDILDPNKADFEASQLDIPAKPKPTKAVSDYPDYESSSDETPKLGGRPVGSSFQLGERFKGSSGEAYDLVRQAKKELPTVDENSYPSAYRDRINTASPTPSLQKLIDSSRAAFDNLTDEEQEAVASWIGSSGSIRNEQRTGLPKWFGSDKKAEAFESAIDKLTVVNPTKHGTLFRHFNANDSMLAELLTKDVYEVGADISTGYFPNRTFGRNQFVFPKVSEAGALIGKNTHESEMIIKRGMRFRIKNRYKNQFGGLTFELEELPLTRENLLKEVGYLAIPTAAGAALSEDGEEGAAVGAMAGMALGGKGKKGPRPLEAKLDDGTVVKGFSALRRRQHEAQSALEESMAQTGAERAQNIHRKVVNYNQQPGNVIQDRELMEQAKKLGLEKELREVAGTAVYPQLRQDANTIELFRPISSLLRVAGTRLDPVLGSIAGHPRNPFAESPLTPEGRIRQYLFRDVPRNMLNQSGGRTGARYGNDTQEAQEERNNEERSNRRR